MVSVSSLLFTLVVATGFGCGHGISTTDQLGYLTYFLNNPGNCNIFTSEQFAVACRVGDLVSSLFNQSGVMISANQVCEGDCRLVMGAMAGGSCQTNPSDGLMYCKCDYESTATSPSMSFNGDFLFQLALSQCGTNEYPILSDFLNDYLCNVDCICSHGYPSSPNNNKCTTSNGVSGNTNQYCVCGGAQNAF